MNKKLPKSRLEVFRIITPFLATVCLFFINETYNEIKEGRKENKEFFRSIATQQIELENQKEINRQQGQQIQKLVETVYYKRGAKDLY